MTRRERALAAADPADLPVAPSCAFVQFNPIQDRRITVMKDKIITFDQTEDEIFTHEVSDEGLEIAAGTAREKSNFTLGACSGLSVCPG